MKPAPGVVLAGALVTALAACSGGGPGEAGAGDGDPGTVTLVTHDSFALSEGLLEAFEAESGYTVKTVATGDAGTLVNQLVLTKGSPLGDVVFGIDNTFASRALEADVLAPYTPGTLPDGAEQLGDGALTPVDQGDVCINADLTWFEEKGLPLPVSLEDLAKPEYKDLLVVTNPATSSPGLAFLLTTIGGYGTDGFEAYWQSLVDNGVKVVDSWEDAYYVDFSAVEGGSRPLVLSYATSPAFTVTEDGSETTTGALLDTCFRQVEYAGVLAGTDNEAGAQALVDFLLSAEVQADVPTSMYMYPADPSVELPEEWTKFAPLAPKPFTADPAEVAEHREEWIEQWTAVVVG
ncbi:thiamine ABC transporter substrate-binding protein [Antribacter gilvus]|uniref:thiamine ABC transporter substrate-binding protein n=1 Tax=Antribacter gilvus TaxID=2304675 RepID=UPI000F76CF9B|nr:thiamine ABC transporter substrate-binding protein [Antribacter gilvus]